jgi:hypothetical protein
LYEPKLGGRIQSGRGANFRLFRTDPPPGTRPRRIILIDRNAASIEHFIPIFLVMGDTQKFKVKREFGGSLQLQLDPVLFTNPAGSFDILFSPLGGPICVAHGWISRHLGIPESESHGLAQPSFSGISWRRRKAKVRATEVRRELRDDSPIPLQHLISRPSLDKLIGRLDPMRCM